MMQRITCKYQHCHITLLAWFSILLFLSCNNARPKNDKHILNFKTFTIEVPESWKSIEFRGVDSYVGGIKAEHDDTLYFDLGRYPVNLEHYAKITEQGKTYFIIQVGDKVVRKQGSLSMDSVLNTRVRWTTIDGRKAKIVYPKITGKGTIGVYIDSLWKLGDDKIVFTMYGDNITQQTEKIFLESIASLKFIHE